MAGSSFSRRRFLGVAAGLGAHSWMGTSLRADDPARFQRRLGRRVRAVLGKLLVTGRANPIGMNG